MSRSKTPNPNQNGSYDQNLLGDAPRATRAQLQGGYDVDLLDDPPQRSQSVRSPATPGVPSSGVPPPIPTIASAIPENISKEKFALTESGGVYTPAAKRPFWRTPKGIIILVVVAIVIIISAVVGGVVGSSKKPSDIKGSEFPTTSSSSTSSTPATSSKSAFLPETTDTTSKFSLPGSGQSSTVNSVVPVQTSATGSGGSSTSNNSGGGIIPGIGR